MSKLVIEEKFNGRITAFNIEKGAVFVMILPISKNKE
jgi:hypothetical protein